ncbi:hypothetical protein JN535_08740 [Cellulosimicrobium cellulans]|uniref:hypothetical protein n=1 Tax=Cellulosimicrobium cellulans TaxID=1710 RepID=UPI0019629933|nr:hypothetical protein [Cellulosimicrobium cellulans]MBN0040249.1 hypothetical protein [Cellulosimicrobium cellulans]
MGREIKTVKIPVGKPGKQQRVLEKEARDGWRLVEIVKGPVLRSWDVAHLERFTPDAAPVGAGAPHVHEWETTSAAGVEVLVCSCGRTVSRGA